MLNEKVAYNFYVNNIINNINEEYHEVTNFDNMINAVSLLIFNNLDANIALFYTGWNWFIDEKICLNINKEYSSHNIKYNINIGCPIYIKFFNEETPVIMFVNDDNIGKNYNITINVNTAYNLSVISIKLKLKHEVTHIRTMYAHKNYNPLSSLKNSGSCIDEKILNNIKPAFRLNIINLFYLLTPTEQEARLNEYIEFVKDYSKNVDIFEQTSRELINKVIIDGYEFNLLDIFYEIYDKLEFFDNAHLYIQSVYIGYLLNKLNYLKLNITDEDLLRVNVITPKYIQKDLENSYKILTFIKNNFDNYLKKIQNVTYKILKENDKI